MIGKRFIDYRGAVCTVVAEVSRVSVETLDAYCSHFPNEITKYKLVSIEVVGYGEDGFERKSIPVTVYRLDDGRCIFALKNEYTTEKTSDFILYQVDESYMLQAKSVFSSDVEVTHQGVLKRYIEVTKAKIEY